VKVLIYKDAGGGWYWATSRKGRITATGAGNDKGNGFANKANAKRSFEAHFKAMTELALEVGRGIPIEYVED
jgi:hypothetical protein